jgi:predicted permease
VPRESRRRIFRLEVGRKHVEHDVDEEIEFHLALRTRALVARGLEPGAAREQALRQFGDLAAVRTECLTIDNERERAMKRADRLGNLRQDVAYAVRMIRRNKGFAAILVLILALGIGSNTAIFTLIDALLLRALPVPRAEQLITIGNPARTGGYSQGSPRSDLASYPLYTDLRDQNRVLDGLYASGKSDRLDVIIAGDSAAKNGRTRASRAEHPHARFVSGNFFSVLQVPAFAGRTFTPRDDQVPSRDPVVVLSHEYWVRRFASDPSAVGKTVTMNGIPLTIIGVAAPGFTGDIVGQRNDLWLPIMMFPSIRSDRTRLDDRGASWLLLMGRLAPGVSLARARTELTTLETRSLIDHARAGDLLSVQRNLRRMPARVEAGAQGFSYYRDAYQTALYTLMAAVALVLLVICANVANLTLARATARGREISVRMALGAGRLRIVQQLLTESLLLALLGGALGLVVALWGSAALLTIAGDGRNRIPLDLRLSGRVLVFTAMLSFITAILFGLVPALRATRTQLAASLRTSGRGLTGAAGSSSRFALGKLLVVAQVALSMLLLVGTAMLVRSTRRLERADLGLARDELIIADLDASRSDYQNERLPALLHDLPERVRRIDGVAKATFSANGIFSGNESGVSVQVEGFTARNDADTLIQADFVGADYFHTIGAQLLKGRDFDERDSKTGPKVAIVNQTMSAFFFPNGDAVGHHVAVDSASWQVVGVVADVQGQGVRNALVRRLYRPLIQTRATPTYLVIRVPGDPARRLAPIRRALVDFDPALAVMGVSPLTDLIRDSISQDRLVSRVVSLFGVLTLVLAALGLYGVMAYQITRRTAEFGLRMALGAEPGRVSRMVLRESLALTAAGVALGLPLALLATRLVRGQLFGIGQIDPTSIAVAILALAASAALAGYVPARRASRVAPLDALRAD